MQWLCAGLCSAQAQLQPFKPCEVGHVRKLPCCPATPRGLHDMQARARPHSRSRPPRVCIPTAPSAAYTGQPTQRILTCTCAHKNSALMQGITRDMRHASALITASSTTHATCCCTRGEPAQVQPTSTTCVVLSHTKTDVSKLCIHSQHLRRADCCFACRQSVRFRAGVAAPRTHSRGTAAPSQHALSC